MGENKEVDYKKWSFFMQTDKIDYGSIDSNILLDSLRSLNSPIYQNLKKQITSYNGDWSSRKSKELSRLFSNNLEIVIHKGKVNLSVKYETYFPIDWELLDIVDWIESTNSIIKAFLCVNMEKLISGMVGLMSENLRKFQETNSEVRDVLEKLKKSETWLISNGDKNWTYINNEWKVL